jgi:hypothetical protein
MTMGNFLRSRAQWIGFAAVAAMLGVGVGLARAADFSVTTPNNQFAFRFTDSLGQSLGDSPTLVLVRGRTYTFAVNTTCNFHPLRVQSAGVVNNNICNGTLTYTVPTNAANYFYDCTIHGQSMRGEITTIAPPTPPVPSIVNFSFGNSIVLRSAPGTNTFAIVPEYKTNLNNTNWVALTVQSNRFVNGTNETFCGRPPGDNVFIRVRVN